MEHSRRVIVIGTGPCGAAAAAELHRGGIEVVVLEAGAPDSANGLVMRAAGLTIARLRRSLAPAQRNTGAGITGPAWFTELSAGGLSNHWTCAVPRFDPQDFHEGERLGERYRWPISYEDLAEHYPRMERVLSIAGPGEDVPWMPGGVVSHKVPLASDWKAVEVQARARGHGLAALPMSYGEGWTFTRSGTPFNSFVRLLGRIPRTPRFQVFFGARALRLEWSGAQRRVTHVVYRDAKTGTEHRLAASAVVVGAGALHSTRLLLESTSADYPQGLGNTEGVLGRYLHDHPLGKVALELSRPLSIHPPVCLTRGPYDSAPPLRASQGVLWGGTVPRIRSWVSRTPGRSLQVGFNFFGTLPPEEKHGVRLAPDRRDADGVAGLDLSIDFDAQTQVLLEGTRDRLLEILDAAGHRAAVKFWTISEIGASVHYGGTVRMHASPRYGMLDAWNRLHAVPNVLVVDSSAFTTGPEKNPTLTAMALASRAAERLAKDLRSEAAGASG